MKTVAVKTALRISPSSQQPCSLLQDFLNASLLINTKIWISIIMAVMAITAIIIVAEVQTKGESYAIQQ